MEAEEDQITLETLLLLWALSEEKSCCNSQAILSSTFYSSLVVKGYNDLPSTIPHIKGCPLTGVILTHQDTKTAENLSSSGLPGAFKEILLR